MRKQIYLAAASKSYTSSTLNVVAKAVACVVLALNAVPALSQNSYNDARIIPPSTDAVGGGNPLQGLGRADESLPSRRSQFEAPDPAPTAPIAGSTNPTVPPDLPSPPSLVDPIQVQRDKEEKERELDEQKKEEAKQKQKEESAKLTNPAIDTPLKKAILEINLRNYEQSLAQLDDIILKNPLNPDAHYLKAVVYVLTRKYGDAEKEYRLVLQHSPNPILEKKARTGLAKLAR